MVNGNVCRALTRNTLSLERSDATVIREGFDQLNQHRPSLRSESDVSFKPVDDKADDEALRDWESEGGAVPASSLPTPS